MAHTQDTQDGRTTTEQRLWDEIKTKILHLLGIYPVISPTMLQGGLGPQIKPIDWRPVLNELIANGEVIEGTASLQTPTDRFNTYTKLSLPGTVVTLAEDAQ